MKTKIIAIISSINSGMSRIIFVVVMLIVRLTLVNMNESSVLSRENLHI